MRALLRLVFACALPLLLAASAAAAELDNDIGQYPDKGGKDPQGNVLFLATVSDTAQRAAGLVLHVFADTPSDRGEDIVVGFFKVEEWRSFMTLWNKARGTILPFGTSAKDLGELTDTHDATEMTVVALADGTIEFRFVGKPGGQYVVKTFDMVPDAFSDFEQDLKTVSDYFGH